MRLFAQPQIQTGRLEIDRRDLITLGEDHIVIGGLSQPRHGQNAGGPDFVDLFKHSGIWLSNFWRRPYTAAERARKQRKKKTRRQRATGFYDALPLTQPPPPGFLRDIFLIFNRPEFVGILPFGYSGVKTGLEPLAQPEPHR